MENLTEKQSEEISKMIQELTDMIKALSDGNMKTALVESRAVLISFYDKYSTR